MYLFNFGLPEVLLALIWSSGVASSTQLVLAPLLEPKVVFRTALTGTARAGIERDDGPLRRVKFCSAKAPTHGSASPNTQGAGGYSDVSFHGSIELLGGARSGCRLEQGLTRPNTIRN